MTTTTKPADYTGSAVEVVDLTKALAKRLLDLNPSFQRPMSREAVDALTREMEEGNWQLTNDAIQVTVDEETGQLVQLINGQHRCQARVNARGTNKRITVMLLRQPHAEATAELTTVKGEAVPDVFLVADTGRARTWSQFVRMMGIPHHSVVGGAILQCEQIERNGGYFTTSRSMRGTNKQRYEWWLNCDQKVMEVGAQLSDPMFRLMKLSRPLFTAWFYMAATNVDHDLAAEFTQKVLGRLPNTGRTDPCQALHDRLTRWALQEATTPAIIRWNTIIRAWHYFLAGEEVERLWWSPKNLQLKVAPDWWDAEAHAIEAEAAEAAIERANREVVSI